MRFPLYMLVCLLTFECAYAKALNGESFRILHGITFPQLGSTNDLNSLQILASPLAGEPFFVGLRKKSSIYLQNDHPQQLLDVFGGSLRDDFQALIDLGKGEVKNLLWSSHLFPTARGGVAYRYQLFSTQEHTWQELEELHRLIPPQAMIKEGRIHQLSPLEKYELFIGNSSFSMATHEWEKGARYFEQYKEVPSWIGLCHGSAPASFQNLPPQKSLTVKSFANQDIVFTPADLKALITFAWAQTGGPSAIMGSRCGRHLQPHLRPGLNCLDTNPAAFHLALINLVGVLQKPLIVDISAGPEVWNRVVQSYRYQFFRPGTRNLTSNFSHSVVDRQSLQADRYRDFRSRDTDKIVGVSMEVRYLVEAKLEQNGATTSSEFKTVTYWYDLELDASDRVIGGEWHSQIHPDFVWVVSENLQPKTIFDHLISGKLETFNGTAPLPPFVRKQALAASERGEVLFEVIQALLRLAQ